MEGYLYSNIRRVSLIAGLKIEGIIKCRGIKLQGSLHEDRSTRVGSHKVTCFHELCKTNYLQRLQG